MATTGPARRQEPEGIAARGGVRDALASVAPVASSQASVVRPVAPPPVVPHAVPRERVWALLDGARHRRLTAVVGGAGWGKSTAVAGWCADRGLRPAWVTLEARDDVLPVFWHRVVAAVASTPVPRHHEVHRLQVPPAITDAFTTHLLHTLGTLPGDVVLVLDDAQHLRSPEVVEAVGDLVRYAPAVHVVLISRTDPPLPLRRLALDGRVGHVRAEHLAFDATDVGALAGTEGVDVEPEDVEHLLERTEGWPVGVRLGLQQLAEPGRAVLVDFGDGDRAVAEYLVEEVLARQEPAVRDFLLRTSVASPLTIDLAAALVPGAPAGRYLEERVAAHDFVSVVTGHGWGVDDTRRDGGTGAVQYRFHPLLRDMLRGTLRFEDPAAYRLTHARAARWHVEHGDPLRALEHAAAAEELELFAQVFVESAALLLPGPDRTAVLAAAHAVPLEEQTQSVWCALCAGAVAGVEGRIPACRHHVARARALLDDLDDAHRGAAEVLVEILDAHAARGRGDVTATTTAATAAHHVLARTPVPFPAFATYRSWAHDLRATGLFWSGRVDAARTELERLVRDDPAPLSLMALNGRAYLALCDAVQGRYEAALERVTTILVLAEQAGWTSYEQLRPAYAAAAVVGLVRGDWRGAERALAYGWAADVGGDEPVLVVAMHALQAQVALAAGRTRAATAALADAARAAEGIDVPPVAADMVARAATDLRVRAALRDEPFAGLAIPGRPSADVRRVCRARTDLARHQTPAAAEEVQEVLADDADLDLLTRVEALLVASGVAEAAREPRRADALARAAFDEAAAEGVVLPFVRPAPPSVRQPVARVAGARTDALAASVRELIGPQAPVAEPAPLAGALTDRELAVLTALATMQSNAEIADDLFVSVNTVKAHLKSLFRKLEVGSRRAAVRRGRELGLLP
ncbi:ATP-dependent transcriptional regulator, MalT-like, LuxR family [Cellulomonas fimi ATCC 484]|uniref:ATP-dependent transcriptional regulator, MalT-like, LuxR family n=1 Tax=Cellulomonas fimi (strain ATCC 484 / DSM 20113 / JCM 1341 / CCUG 24087 / LMG 16345 / NBRC 15513 / NCIMB 8980 / NCTC 7547 / NRS-133) TaxID=590998 RepID=F4H0X9_CELFA|nr:ATP-dependent transcriptional regulator, MalT-like, LuxR family [Cellulomonas fimi ATCC 484]VEH32138.1 ATP-dependent transcriptional activator malT [Cellulomonas fimi]